MIGLQGLRGSYEEVFVPLYGAHQAQNAVLALAAVEAFVGGDDPLDEEVVKAAFAEVTSPGRLEIIRRSPTIVLDAAHNPHGAAALVAALEDSFTFSPLIGVLGVIADKDCVGFLAELEPVLAHVDLHPELPDAVDADRRPGRGSRRFRPGQGQATASAWQTPSTRRRRSPRTGGPREAIGSGGVLVTGSVVTVGEARSILRPRPHAVGSATSARTDAAAGCARRSSPLEAIAFGLVTPVLISIEGTSTTGRR